MRNQNILATKEESFLEETLTQTITTIEKAPPSRDVTLLQIEEEIKLHLNQIKQNIIEIGKRLITAKPLVPHVNGKTGSKIILNSAIAQQKILWQSLKDSEKANRLAF